MTTDTVPDPSTAGPENLPAADDEQPGDRSTPSMTPPPPETPLPITPLPATPPAPASPDAAAEASRLRAEYAEIAAIAVQGGRLGVTIDAADAMARGLAPASLRRTILDTLAARAEASAVVAVAPVATGDSPIVRRARERAAANHTSQ